MEKVFMNRTFRYRLYPTSTQANSLDAMRRDHCTLYNAALQERRDAYKTCRHSVKYSEQSSQLSDVRSVDIDQSRWSFTSQQQTLRRLDKSFQSFFRRLKQGQMPGYPRFKPLGRFNTITFVNGDGAKWLDKKARLQGIGHVKVKLHRPTQGTVKQISITKSGNKWHASVICVDVPAQLSEKSGNVVGLDRGITHLLADSNGGFTKNPRHTRTAEHDLTVAQQALSRCKRGSNRRKKAVARVQVRHEKIKNVRADYLHKLSRQLVDEYDVIVMEDLRVAVMVKRPKPLSDNAPNGAAAKSGLNKSIQDASWSKLANMIEYKAESAGVQVIYVPAANTSRTCYVCGHCSADNRNKELFSCLSCGHKAHADTNAALNILRLGLSRREALCA